MPTRQTQSLTYAEVFSRIVIAAFKTNPAAAVMPTITAHLIMEEGFALSPQTTTAEAEAAEADFTDYVAKAVTLVEPANVGSQVEGAIATVMWNMTTDPVVTTNTIYGYFLESAGDFVAGEMFPEGQSVTMAELADYLILNLVVMFQNYQSVLTE